MRILIAAAIALAPYSVLASVPAHAEHCKSFLDLASGTRKCTDETYSGPQPNCSNSMFSSLPKCPIPCSKSETDKHYSKWPPDCDLSQPMTD